MIVVESSLVQSLNSPFFSPLTRSGSVPIWDGKKGEFRDWTKSSLNEELLMVIIAKMVKIAIAIAIKRMKHLTPTTPLKSALHRRAT